MSDFVAALGLVLVIEGILYALAPNWMRRLAKEAMRTPDESLRVGGLVAVGLGVAVVWAVRG